MFACRVLLLLVTEGVAGRTDAFRVLCVWLGPPPKDKLLSFSGVFVWILNGGTRVTAAKLTKLTLGCGKTGTSHTDLLPLVFHGIPMILAKKYNRYYIYRLKALVFFLFCSWVIEAACFYFLRKKTSFHFIQL